MSAPEMWCVVDGLGGVREVPVRVEGQLLLVGPGPQPRYYGSEEPPRLALMHYALTMRWPLARILAPGEALDDADAQRTRAEAAEAEVARLTACLARANGTIEAQERARYAAEDERDAAVADVARLRAIIDGRTTAPTEPMCECGHPVDMHRGADRCGAHGCGCDRNAEEASWR